MSDLTADDDRKRIVRAFRKWAYLDQLDLLDELIAATRDELRTEDYGDDEEEGEARAELDLRAAEHMQGAADEVHEARDNLVRNDWQYP